jgi:hypothetical protein
MGFTLESRPNPLALLGQAAGDTSLTIGRQNRQERILNNALGLLNNADDDPTSFIGSISRLSPDNQRLALGALDIKRQKAAEQKAASEAQQIAQAYGIQYAPGMTSKDVLERVKEKEKLDREARDLQKDQAKAQEIAQKLGIDYTPGMTTKNVFDLARATKPAKKTQASQPIDPEQLAIIRKIRETDKYKNADPLTKYQLLTDNGVSRENAESEADIASKQSETQTKAFDTAYKANEDFINETTQSYKAFETEMKPKLLQMRNINDKDLINPSAAVFLETFGIPLGALSDPSSELYNKLSQDLLKGLPETYGNRILKVEVDNFLKTIPQLVNSADGRRMIASNMLKLGEMKEVYYNAMREMQQKALESSKFPRDFQQTVFDQVKPQINRINNEFIKLSEIKRVPEGTIPFFNPNGNIEFVPEEDVQWAIENGGKRIW